MALRRQQATAEAGVAAGDAQLTLTEAVHAAFTAVVAAAKARLAPALGGLLWVGGGVVGCNSGSDQKERENE